MKIRTAYTVTLAAVAGFVSSPINAELAETESAPTYQKIDEKIAEINLHYASKMANMANLSEKERAVMQTNMVREGKRITTYMTLTTLTRDEINNKTQDWLQGLKALIEREDCEQTIGSDWFYRSDFTHETVFTSSDGHEVLTASVGPFECFTGKLVKIPDGSFRMGDNEGEWVKPVHTVSVESFYMQEHEVTWAQYQRCVDAGACWDIKAAVLESEEDEKEQWWLEDLYGWAEGDRPVVGVSWNDVQSYIGWLNKETSRKFRLPSEAEWEYAARAGSATKYSWGDDVGTNRTNCERCTDIFDFSDEDTAPVKSFMPNAGGLYDMHGNAEEWVQDCWHPNYLGAPTDGSAWISGGDCSQRVLRGGGAGDNAWDVQSAARISRNASKRDIFRGFRLVEER